MTIEVRQAVAEDVAAVVDVGRLTWPATYLDIAGPEYVERGLAKWWSERGTLELIEAGRVLVAEAGGQIAGMSCASTVDTNLVIWKLYVLPEFQRRSAGSLLLEEMIRIARSKSLEQIKLAYAAGNENARAFYVKSGFVETGREHDEGGGPDNVWMARPAGSPTGS